MSVISLIEETFSILQYYGQKVSTWCGQWAGHVWRDFLTNQFHTFRRKESHLWMERQNYMNPK